jgi:hypothetical protein
LCASSGLFAQVIFVDRAPETGTTNLSLGRGSAMVDLDGDGLLDIIAGNSGMPNEFFRQLPDNTFTSANSDWAIAFDERTTWGVLAADFDNDGDPDVYFINGGFTGSEPNQLLRNDLNTSAVFSDVSGASGDGALVSHDFGGTAFDYDLDGDLDIFLTTTEDQYACTLLRNDGDLFFTDVSGSAGLVELGRYRHCTSGDFNNDGWLDVAVGNNLGANLLYRNNGDGTFTDVAASAGVEDPDQNFGLVLEDFDNDGFMDIYVPKYYKQNPPGPSQLYCNNGDGTFRNVTAGSGMTGQADMGHTSGDLDADGYPDIFIGTGTPAAPMYDVLFLITPDGAGGLLATDVSESSGITSAGPSRCHGMALGDYDQDGFIDVYTNNGGVGTLPDQMEENCLWQNQGNANQWTALSLTGVISNRDAVGTRSVAVTSAGRRIHRCRRVGHGFANTDSPTQHFGVGPTETIDRIEITWPSGITQSVVNPPMSQVLEVTECLAAGNPNPGDHDQDGDVDIDDFAEFATCCSGPGNPPPRPQCGLFDLDCDNDVDLVDYAELAQAFTG